MSRAAILTIGAAAGVAAWMAQNWQPEQIEEITADVVETIETAAGGLMPYSIAINMQKNKPFVDALRAAQARYGIPADILVAQAYTESRFNPKAVSPVGAAGIMQFMPATAREWGIDPFEPFQSIDAAGRYMAKLKSISGSWSKAIAAYNWGIGNVTRKGMTAMPEETRNYLAQVTNLSGANIA